MLRQALGIAFALTLLAAAPAHGWPHGLNCDTEGGHRLAYAEGANCRRITHGGESRRYVVYVPQRALDTVAGGGRVPMVMMLHGTGGHGERFYDSSGWRQLARVRGFVAVFPTALLHRVDEDPANVVMRTQWSRYNLADTVDESYQQPADDVAFLRTIVRQVKNQIAVRHSKVFLSGFSNGGELCQRAALELTRKFQAFGCAAGSVGDRTRRVTPGAPLRPVMWSFGNLDHNLVAVLQHDDPSVQAAPMDPGQLFSYPTMVEFGRIQLETVELTDQADVVIRRPELLQLRFDEPVPGATASEFHFLLLEGVAHAYPRAMVPLLWRFFNRRP